MQVCGCLNHCLGCVDYETHDGIPVETGAGGMGDGLQGMCVVAFLAQETQTEVQFGVGPISKPFVELFDIPGVKIVETSMVHNEKPTPHARQMNIGYSAEYLHGPGKEDQPKGIDSTPRWERYQRNIGAKGFVIPSLKKQTPIPDEKFVVLAPFSTDNQRAWHQRLWLELERILIAAGYKTAIIGRDNEIEKPKAIRFKGKVFLSQSPETVAGLMLNSICVVGPDSGPAHLAGVLQVPLVVLGYQHLHNIYGCYPTARFVKAPHDIVDSIRPREVMAAIDDIHLSKLTDNRSLISKDRLATIRDQVLATNHLEGDTAEIGVYKGGSAKVIAAYAPDVMLHLFDTFFGIPEDDVCGGHKAGEFSSNLDEVDAFLGNGNFLLHDGFFPETTRGYDGIRYRFVHIDCDIGQTVKAAIEYFSPRMVEGGIMVLDDYGWWKCPGVQRALHEAFPVERIIKTAEYQAKVCF